MKLKTFVALVCVIYIGSQPARAQSFPSPLTTELGGGLAFSFQKNSSQKELSLSVFYASLYAGLMVAKGFELGLYPEISSVNISSSSTTIFSIYLAPAYNFDLKSNVYPYVELLAGIGSMDSPVGTESSTGIGANAGLKINLRGSAMMVIGAQYLRQNFDPQHVNSIFGNDRESYTIDILSLSLGFRVFFIKKAEKDKSAG